MGIHTPQSLPPTPVISGTQGRGGHTEILIGMGGDREKGGERKPKRMGGGRGGGGKRQTETQRQQEGAGMVCITPLFPKAMQLI